MIIVYNHSHTLACCEDGRSFREGQWVRTKKKFSGQHLLFPIDGFWAGMLFGDHPVTGDHLQLFPDEVRLVKRQRAINNRDWELT